MPSDSFSGPSPPPTAGDVAGLPARGEDVAVGDFLIPSVLEAFCDWRAPTVADDAPALLELADISGTFDEKAAWISELVDRLVEVLEPTLILLALTDHHVHNIVVAASGGTVAPSLVPGADMRIAAIVQGDLPAAITDAFAASPTVVALETSPRFDLPVPLTGLRDGWLTILLPGSGAALDLTWVLDHLRHELDSIHSALLDDIEAAVGDTALGDLRNDPAIPSGLLTLYDPATWTFRSVSDPDRDALDEADPDAVALFALAYEMMVRVSAGGLDPFLREELGRDLWGVVDLRGRLDESREERRLLRRGLRGARRRRRKIGEDGHRRDFRRAQSRTLTYTEILLGLHEMGVADILHPPAALVDPGAEEPGTEEPEEPEPLRGELLFGVRNDVGGPVEGAVVQLLDAEGAVLTRGTTDGLGGARVEGPAADYSVHLTHPEHEEAWVDATIVGDATTPVDVVMRRALIRTRVRCRKIKSMDLTVDPHTPVHSCRVYVFNDDSARTYTEISAEVKSDGEIDHDLVKNKPYLLYFAGRTLDDDEIDRLRVERPHVLIPATIEGPYLDIDSSFFWWIALLQYVESKIQVEDPNERSAEVLTCVRYLYYDDPAWPYLIDRSDVEKLIRYDAAAGTGSFTVRDDVDVEIVMALGRTYELADESHFLMVVDNTESGPRIVRSMKDRHEYVILPDGESIHIGHALAGLEAFLFPPSYIGSWVFEFPRSAATWAGDLGQAVYNAFHDLLIQCAFLRPIYDDMWQYSPDAVSIAWDTAVAAYGRYIELVGDVHGIALGRDYVTGGEPGAGAHLPTGRPLSELLEDHFIREGRGSRALQMFVDEYAHYGLTYATVKNGGMSTIVGLQAEVASFAETWDDTPRRDLYPNWNGTSGTDRQLIGWAVAYLNDVLNIMDW